MPEDYITLGLTAEARESEKNAKRQLAALALLVVAILVFFNTGVPLPALVVMPKVAEVTLAVWAIIAFAVTLINAGNQLGKGR